MYYELELHLVYLLTINKMQRLTVTHFTFGMALKLPRRKIITLYDSCENAAETTLSDLTIILQETQHYTNTFIFVTTLYVQNT